MIIRRYTNPGKERTCVPEELDLTPIAEVENMMS